jgi:hypothetical protein
MDIRARCCPMRNLKQFKNCGARVNTAYFHMMNDCETYREINSKKTNKQKEKVMVSYLHHKLKIIPCVEKDKVIAYYWEQDEDEEEDEIIETCSVCNIKKKIDDIVCIQFKPIKVWKCCDCNYKQIMDNYNEEGEIIMPNEIRSGEVI